MADQNFADMATDTCDLDRLMTDCPHYREHDDGCTSCPHYCSLDYGDQEVPTSGLVECENCGGAGTEFKLEFWWECAWCRGTGVLTDPCADCARPRLWEKLHEDLVYERERGTRQRREARRKMVLAQRRIAELEQKLDTPDSEDE